MLFIVSGIRHLSPGDPSGGYARSQGVPFPGVAVPLAGLIALAGGVSVLLGFHAQVGAWLLVLFLVPVTLSMHRFWGLSDAGVAAMQQAQFMKNWALIGAALLIAHFGSGPYSLAG